MTTRSVAGATPRGNSDEHVLAEVDRAVLVLAAQLRRFHDLLDDLREPAVGAGVGRRPPAGPLGSLTRREGEVLALVARGLANRQAARALGISEHTVKAHLSAVYRKLGVATRGEAAAVLAAWRASASQEVIRRDSAA